jgi:amino acid adenylation domain-containing protein
MHIGRRLASNINVGALQGSINELVRRHESLRTSFQAVDGEPAQVILTSLSVEVPATDLRQLPESEREDKALEIAAKEAERPFALDQWPLFRTRLIRLADEDYIFLLTIHHIVCDFWSLNIIESELNANYRAFLAGQASALPDLPIQYADYAEWEWRWLEGTMGRSHLEYWKKQLAELPILRLPTDRPRPRLSTFTGLEHDFLLEESLYKDLVRLSQEEKVTLFMTMLAAFQTLLCRYSGQDDVAVGTPVANRNRAEIENLVGFFVNSLVLRTDLSGNPTFRELLGRVRDVALDAFAHQDFPFERLVHELNPRRGADHNPLFQVHFQLFSDQGTVGEESLLGGEPLGGQAGTAKFDLALDLWESPEGLWAHVEYSTELFDRESILQMERHFRTLLEGVVANPDQRISDLPLLDDDERRQVLEEWNRTETDYPHDMCLHELFDARAEKTPEAIALVFRGERISYRDLNARANRLGNYLRSRGIGPENLVAICVDRSVEMTVGLLGILKAGGAYLPLDPNDPVERLRLFMEDARPKMLLTQEKFLGRFPEFPQERVLLDLEWHKIVAWSDDNPKSGANSGNLAYVIYTSGSTGVPKAVMVASRTVVNHLSWMQAAFPLTSSDCILQKYPFNFDASVCEIFGTLIAGASLIIAEPAAHWDLSEFVRLLKEHEITALDILPSMLRVLLEEEGFPSCRSLRRVICGGEPLTPELAEHFLERFDAELHNIYGPTEATIGATHWACVRGQVGDRVPIGRPIANTRIYLVDRWLNPVPVGVPGEICIGGEGVARGYLNRPEMTSERFVKDPFSGQPDGRLYRTGDLGRYRRDGNIEYLGRIDEQVKVRGHRVEPAEIQRTLAQNPAVEDCAVLPVEDEAGHKKLVAWITPVPDPPELWPSVGEHDVYDELLYYAMTHDEPRNRAYRSAIQKSVHGKIVLEIGTGADAILARFCVEAGAERVYAVEQREDAWRRASNLIETMGLAGRILLIQGDSTKLLLPEKVDVCVSEILGTIGSSEGVIPILNDARRFLKDVGIMIPQRCVTRIAAVSLPENLVDPLRLNELPSLYTRRVFEKHNHPFDLRVCIKNFPLANVISEEKAFESLDFTGYVEPSQSVEARLRIDRDSRLDGFLLWLKLSPGQDEWIDSLRQRLDWLPVFFPVFYPGLAVSAGDFIEAKCVRRAGGGGLLPDYEINGVLIRKRYEPVGFRYQSPWCSSEFRANAFYQSLFASLDDLSSNAKTPHEYGHGQVEGTSRGLVPTLRRYLQERLPEYMVPSSFVVVPELPRTPTGKIDQRALPKHSQTQLESEAAFAIPTTRVEQIIDEVWRDVLDIEQVGIHDNFFDLGGDSLLISAARSRLELALNKKLSITDLFQYPTVHSLARFVEEGEVQTDLLAKAQDRARKQLAVAGQAPLRIGAFGND